MLEGTIDETAAILKSGIRKQKAVTIDASHHIKGIFGKRSVRIDRRTEALQGTLQTTNQIIRGLRSQLSNAEGARVQVSHALTVARASIGRALIQTV